AEGAVRLHADLVVMTTHGRSGFSRLRLGSVAAAFLTRAVAPVYLVHATDAGLVPSSTNAMLCALDGSAFSERVLPHAVALAQRRNV
ncbi:universal stress protein, partial [Campylobacter jejuni]|uniref:universal stress protein n=1 Tax=Campylobacter jejuni TaxID=197 RepID=UPI001E536DAE